MDQAQSTTIQETHESHTVRPRYSSPYYCSANFTYTCEEKTLGKQKVFGLMLTQHPHGSQRRVHCIRYLGIQECIKVRPACILRRSKVGGIQRDRNTHRLCPPIHYAYVVYWERIPVWQALNNTLWKISNEDRMKYRLCKKRTIMMTITC